MCGIVGGIAQRGIGNILLEGLLALEYRGYDSAGICLAEGDSLNYLRSVGKVAKLAKKFKEEERDGSLGIAHTRWATHGGVNTQNSHPHRSDSLYLVHNGIIENYQSLKTRLIAEGYAFTSETDTECFAHLIHSHYQKEGDLLQAIRQARKEAKGAYSIAIFDSKNPNQLIGIRRGSPLLVGVGIGELFLASDHLALLPVTRKFIYLEEGDLVVLKREISPEGPPTFTKEFFNEEGQPVTRQEIELEIEKESLGKGQYKHYMQKEIHEQSEILFNLVKRMLTPNELFPPSARSILKDLKAIQIVACGTSYNAGLVVKYWVESLLDILCLVETASEFRYRKAVTPSDTLFISISQSGETADTLAALEKAKREKNYLGTLALCNVPNSSLVRESDFSMMMEAGREVSVASTKAFTAQLTSFLILIHAIAKEKGDEKLCQKLEKSLVKLPEGVTEVLKREEKITSLASHFVDKKDALYLGRGSQFPIALEGALKLKEISYIHASAYAAGELKHGPLALVDSQIPVVVVAPNNTLLKKLHSNIEEVKARGGCFYLFTDAESPMEYGENGHFVSMPSCDDLLAPITYSIGLQLLAYHIAVHKGTDVDQPRNLAKSVTVE